MTYGSQWRGFAATCLQNDIVENPLVLWDRQHCVRWRAMEKY